MVSSLHDPLDLVYPALRNLMMDPFKVKTVSLPQIAPTAANENATPNELRNQKVEDSKVPLKKT